MEDEEEKEQEVGRDVAQTEHTLLTTNFRKEKNKQVVYSQAEQFECKEGSRNSLY